MLAEYEPFDRAACRGARWWPWPNRTPAGDELWQVALDTCGRCSCRRACARLALRQGSEAVGVWAGVVLDGHGNGTELLRRVLRGQPVRVRLPVQLRLALG